MVKKLKFYNNFKVLNKHKNSIILIGNFDGPHLGHQKLFDLAKKYKKKFKLKIGVITFEPMPKMYFNKSLKNFRISNLSQKVQNLEKLNIDFILSTFFFIISSSSGSMVNAKAGKPSLTKLIQRI